MSGDPYPAQTAYADDDGFIGYSLDYTVAFLSLSLSFTDPRATVVLKVEFYITGHGEVNVDVPCVGREPIGRFWVTNRKNPNLSYVEIGISPKLLPSGKLVLQEELLNVFVSFFHVDTITVAAFLLSYLVPFGGLYGFLIDQILSREIGWRLPLKLQNLVRDIMGKLNWTIFDISNFDLNIVADKKYVIQPAFSRTSDSVLLGFEIAKG
jgi:hypothetical protein